ncbi:MAG: right-handed parallel beta-helix repeat-containing protein [Candidatus Hodarchaeota archaeon]
MKKTLLRRKWSILQFLIITTIILNYGNSDNLVQTMSISHETNDFVTSENIDVPLSVPKISSSGYLEHDPIFITSNNHFSEQGFLGTGTNNDPYIIEGLNITAYGGSLISIRHTTAYFCIRNNLVNGLKFPTEGIYLSNVMNGRVENNIICNNKATDGGIILESSTSLIINNSIFDNNMGINVNGNNNTIVNNTIYNNDVHAIWLNIGSCNNTVLNNSIYDNRLSGIEFEESNYNSISNNTLYNNTDGIVASASRNNLISRNNISYNNGEGLIFLSESSNNIVKWNNFIDNIGQANDDGSNNIFAFNYWNEWTSPDVDTDGFVDNHYTIDGGNQDPYPLTYQYPAAITDVLTRPTLLVPNGGEIYSLNEGIQWLPAIDSLGHEVGYSINISANNGLIWEILISGVITTNYSWDTFKVADGPTYLIKVIANCSQGEKTEDTSDGIFSVHNTLSSPTVLFPNGGEILNGTIPIQWSTSFDPLDHNVFYTVYYSINDGSTWILLDSGLTTSSYDWDTTVLTTGTSFTIKVEATCTEELISEDVSDGPFMVHYLTTPTISSSLEGETLKGIVTIQWTASTDSFGQDVTYSIYYSPDNGLTWIPVVSGLTTTSYAWNTNNLPDGTNYKVKVVATSIDGLNSENILEGTFSVYNAPPPPPDVTFFIIIMALLAIIPELYLGKKLSRSLSRKKVEKGVETI